MEIIELEELQLIFKYSSYTIIILNVLCIWETAVFN